MHEYIFIRERMRPYVHSQMDAASRAGLPLMRQLFIDFPDDPLSWEIEDEFMFGTDLLVPPVVTYEARERVVYLPDGAAWTDVWSGRPVCGGKKLMVAAPLGRISLFVRDGATLPLVVA
jgi:alpha-D-xyloside xylohydrolase